jgi:two-component system sensor histidine kinase UhpB
VTALVTNFNEMLARLKAESTASTGRALQVQESERQRIGRELHDEVDQSLTVPSCSSSSGIVDHVPLGLVDQLRTLR